MRDNITRGNMDDRMAAKWFPFIGALFLFIWYSNLIGFIPLPTNTEEKFNALRRPHPVVRALRGDRERLGPARARAVVFIVFNVEGVRAQGRRSATSRASIPAGVHGADGLVLIVRRSS